MDSIEQRNDLVRRCRQDDLYTTSSSGRFEALLPAGDCELNVDAGFPSGIKANRRFRLSGGAGDLDLGEIELK